jgi:hypothetical protein
MGVFGKGLELPQPQSTLLDCHCPIVEVSCMEKTPYDDYKQERPAGSGKSSVPQSQLERKNNNHR